MTIIRSNAAQTDDADSKKERNLSVITMALVKQFSEGKCLNKDSNPQEEPLASSPAMKPEADDDQSEPKATVDTMAPSNTDEPLANIDKSDVKKSDVADQTARDDDVRKHDVEPVPDYDDETGEDSNSEKSKDSNDKDQIGTKSPEFESVSEADEKRPRESSNEDDEPCVVPMTTDDDDNKSDNANDVFADDEDEAKEKANVELSEALDLNSIPGSEPLNLEAGKQKVLLRQRSTNKRRKPSNRSTILRDSACAEEIFSSQISTQSQGSESPPIVNGHCDVGDDEDMDRPDGSSPHAVHRLHSDNDASMTQAPPSPVLLPGLGEIMKRPKKTKQPVPLPGDKPTDTEPSVPPWLAEIQQKHRRHKTPPKGESEKLQLEAEPEKPAWMKLETSSGKDSDKPAWLRHASTEPGPEVEKPAWIRSSDTEPEVTEDKPTSFKSKTPPRGEVEKTQKDLSNTQKPAWLKDVLAKRRKTQEILHSAEEWESGKDKGDQSTVQGASQGPTHKQQDDPVKDDMTSHKSGYVPSAVDSSSSGKPPSEASSRYGFTHGKSMSPAPSSGTDSEPEPPWKAEVKQRKQKTYLQPKKPEQPLRLGELPDWKKELMEKNKRRGSDSAPPTSSAEGTTTVPPWQKELAQRRGSKRSSISSKGSGSDREDEENVPEWARQARQLRRSRIASSGVNNLEDSGRL